MASGKDSRMNIVYTSIYSILGGVTLDAIAPMFERMTHESIDTSIPKLLTGMGVIGIGYYAWHWSKFDRIFRNLGLGIDSLYPIQKSVKHGDYSTEYKFTLPTGLTVEEIDKKRAAFEQWLGKKVSIEYINRGLFIIEVYHNTSNRMYDYDDTIEVEGEIAFPMGYDLHERLITCVLSNCDNNVHMMIAGSSGGGKSVLLRVIITYLITKKNVDLYLIDLKGTELNIFEKCACVKDVCYDEDKVLGMLNEINKIMKHRYTIFRNNGVRDIIAYNQKHKKNPMKFIVVAVDEFSELMENDTVQREFERTAQLSRASGISLIICTQRPDAKVISSRIKACICVVAGLKTSTDINSRIIIDNDSLTQLRGNGHCMFRYGIKDTELQGMFISDKEIERLIQPFEINKDKKDIATKDETIKPDLADLDIWRNMP